jgi:hypothetical protein
MRGLKITPFLIVLFVLACHIEPREDYGRARASAICRAQKQYFKQNGRHGTISELVKAQLIKSTIFEQEGYESEIKFTETGYIATVIPNNFAKAAMFYVDEKGIIKTHYGDTNIQPNDPECSYPNGAKCPCYDE